MLDLPAYEEYYFDCDGVILNSNAIKTEAFAQIAAKYGEETARKFTDYHKANGGISRYEKMKYLFTSLLGMPDGPDTLHKINTGVEEFGSIVLHKLLETGLTDGFSEFMEQLPESRKYVVSGGKETELREIFAKRKLDIWFDGIYGSPDTKFEIVGRLRQGRQTKGIMFGDSVLDYEVAKFHGLDFVFIHGYTELKNWQGFCDKNNIRSVRDFGKAPEKEKPREYVPRSRGYY